MADHNRNDSVFLLETDEVVDVDELRHAAEAEEHDVPTEMSSGADVQVFARFRPLNDREAGLGEIENKRVYHYRTEGDNRTIEMLRPPSSVLQTEKEFTFDGIFPEETTQAELYQKTARPLVAELLKGKNVTVMAYGQTGSGKSYTMTGNLNDEAQVGIIPRMIQDLFDEVAARSEHVTFTLQCSMVQLYMEKVSDLLNPELDNLKLREVISRKFSKSKKLKSVKSCVFIEGCTVCTVKSWKDMLKVMRRGDQNRVTAETDMNQRSSRSHAVFVVNVIQTEVVKQTRRSSKLFLVDLAGSEQVQRSGATGLTLEQAKKINKSLSALSLVIQSLVEKKKGSHVPYRDSKLTRLLTDSLGGNAKTVLLLALSPSYDSVVETYSTLGFGARAKKMENNATVNEELTIGTYKKLVSALGKDVDAWKRKCEEVDQKYQALVVARAEAVATDQEYQALVARCQALEQAKAAADAEVVRLQQVHHEDVEAAEDNLLQWQVALGLSPPPPDGSPATAVTSSADEVRALAARCHELEQAQRLAEAEIARLKAEQDDGNSDKCPSFPVSNDTLEADPRYRALVARCQELEQAQMVAEAELVRLKAVDDDDDDGDEVHVTVEDATQPESGEDPTRRPLVPVPRSPGYELSLDDLCMFQTGNMIVFGADKMFTFEAF